jgi:hypothetical protein
VIEMDDPLPIVRAADIADTQQRPRWLVEPLWARAGVGILGGAPKCCKSWLALEMALAVASGGPCLGAFAVQDAGTVLVYMAEDAAPVVKTRLRGICRHRGLDLGALPVHLITAPALRLDVSVRRSEPQRLYPGGRRAARPLRDSSSVRGEVATGQVAPAGVTIRSTVNPVPCVVFQR